MGNMTGRVEAEDAAVAWKAKTPSSRMDAGTRRSGLQFAHAVSVLSASAIVGGEGHPGRAVAMRNYAEFQTYPEFQTWTALLAGSRFLRMQSRCLSPVRSVYDAELVMSIRQFEIALEQQAGCVNLA